MTPQDTMRLALEALNKCIGRHYDLAEDASIGDAIEALRSALAQQEPLPPPECQTEAEKTAYAFGWWKALETVNRDALAQQGEPQPVNSGEFAKWYWKACDSSQPDDWMMAALAAQRILATSRPDEAAPAPQTQQSDDYMRGFHDGMKEAPTGECWIRVIDEAMVGAHLGVADMADDYGTAKKKLNDLICWSVEIDRESARHAPAAQPDWSLLEATQESLREHMAMVKELQDKLAQQGEPVAEVYIAGTFKTNIGTVEENK